MALADLLMELVPLVFNYDVVSLEILQFGQSMILLPCLNVQLRQQGLFNVNDDRFLMSIVVLHLHVELSLEKLICTDHEVVQIYLRLNFLVLNIH